MMHWIMDVMKAIFGFGLRELTCVWFFCFWEGLADIGDFWEEVFSRVDVV